MKNALIAAVVILLAAAGVFFIMNNRDDEQPETNNQTQTQTQETTEATENQTETTPQTAAVTIVYTDNGFNPSSYTATAGTLVAIKNESSRVLDFASDAHPIHQDNQELNVGVIDPGETTTFTVQETGTWGFHNHEFENHTGTIKVE